MFGGFCIFEGMTKVTLEVDSPEKADLLVKLLQSIDFVQKIETLDETDELTREQIEELERRLELLEKGDVKLKTWEEVRAGIKNKYGI